MKTHIPRNLSKGYFGRMRQIRRSTTVPAKQAAEGRGSSPRGGAAHTRVWALVATAIVAAGIVFGAAPAMAAPTAVMPPAGDITVPVCEGATADINGVDNTPTGSMTLTGTAEADLRAGKTVFLYDNKGQIILLPDGTYNGPEARVPFCGVKADLDTGLITVAWRYCTDEQKSACGGLPPSPIAGNSKLTDEQAAEIAFLLHYSDDESKRARAILQTHVWCISEGFQPGDVDLDAQGYFNTYQFHNGTELTTEEMTCPEVPQIPEASELAVAGPGSTTDATHDAQFTVTTNFPGLVALAVTGADSPVALCPATQDGITLSGNELRFSQAGSATVCATRATAGTIELDASATDLPVPDQLTYVNATADCQVFADYGAGARAEVSADATAAFVVADGLFSITKDVVWGDAVPVQDMEFSGTYSSEGPTGEVTTGSFSVSDGATWTSGPLAEGSLVHLEETAPTAPPSLAWSEPVFSQNDFVVDAETATVITLTNQAALRTGAFSASKTLTGDAVASVPDDTVFALAYEYPAGPGYAEGSGILQLPADGTIVESDALPYDAVVALHEVAPAEIAGTTWGEPQLSATTITIGEEGEVGTVTVTNEITTKVPDQNAPSAGGLAITGPGAVLPLAGLGAMLVIAGMTALAIRRQRSRASERV